MLNEVNSSAKTINLTKQHPNKIVITYKPFKQIIKK